MTTKTEEYAHKILSHIDSIFIEKNGVFNKNKNYIDLKELDDPQNMKAFLHALANIAPTLFYNQSLGANLDVLQFNHIANHIIFDLRDTNPPMFTEAEKELHKSRK